jgi:phage minor structural protein
VRALQIFDDKKKRIGTLSGFKNREITTTLDSGDKELSFSYPATGVLVDLLKEEYYIRTKTDEFVLKAVEKGEQFNKYTAVLNVEELEGTAFPYGFESDEQTIKACLEFAFEGTGWHVGTCTVTKKRTIDEQEHVTAWDVLQKCLTTYRCECIIHSLTKTVDIYDRIGSDKGCYFMEGLNLRKISLKSDTYDFYTRIYPIGKDGITPKWLTGKDYIDNFQYSSKIKAYVWKDERYTNTTSLIEDATAKIEEMSRPYKAYTAEVVDLANASEEYKDILSYGIGDTVTLVSKKTRTKEKQRIVKIREYPETPKKNTVEISNARKTFAEIQKEETAAATEEAISIANNNTKKVLRDGYYTKTDVESHITAAKDEINLGVSKTYETKKTVTEKCNAAESNANKATDEKLTEYSTTEEMKSAIDMKADEINIGVSKTAQDAAAQAESNANTNLENYKKVANAAIELNANAIKSKVTADEVTSQIEQSAESIRCQAEKISWKSDNSEMTEKGELTCNNINIQNGKVFIKQEGNEAKFEIRDSDGKRGFTLHKANLYGYNSLGAKTITIGNGDVGFINCRYENGDNYPASSLGFGNLQIKKSSTEYTNITATGLSCTGTKNRIVNTSDYNDRLLYCYETPSPMFGDVGAAQIDDTGKCLIFIDEKFSQTIDLEYRYDVFLTKYGAGDCYVSERTPSYFVVEGTKNLKFAWEIKSIQRDYENLRLEEYTLEQDDTDNIYDVSEYLNTLLYQLD